ncbi:MAG: metallophosphoesterase [Planctomycetes bacterium]|nr:metallophosphoesterase [Planctomycetota bacterium]
MKRLPCVVVVLCVAACLPSGLINRARAAEETPFARGPYVSKVTTNSAVLFLGAKAPIAALRLTWREADDVEEKALPADKLDHEVLLSDLKPGTIYLYEIKAGDTTVKGKFTTAPKKPRPFRFAAYGDTRSQPAIHKIVADAIAKEDPEFVLHTGDLVDDGGDEEDWPEQFFGPAQAMLRRAAIFPAMGNHEGRSKLYFKYFGLSDNKAWHTFTWGSVQVFVVDTCSKFDKGSTQWKWLDAALADSKAAWKVVVQHHPGVSSSRHGFNGSVNKHLRPLYEKCAVDVVFLGHDHIYQRTKPIAGPGGHGVTYVIVGGGGAPLYPAKQVWWAAVSESAYSYVVVDVGRDSLHVVAKKPGGEVIDNFKLEKAMFEEVK